MFSPMQINYVMCVKLFCHSLSILFSETEKDRMTFGRNIKNIQNEDRKKERYARHFIGKLIKKKENKEYDVIEGHYLTGALFELGLVKGKRIVFYAYFLSLFRLKRNAKISNIKTGKTIFIS